MDVLYLSKEEIRLIDDILSVHWHISCREAFDRGLRDKLERQSELSEYDWWLMGHALIPVHNPRFPHRNQLISIKQRIQFMDRSERPRPNSHKPESKSDQDEVARLYNISNKRNVLTLVFTHPSINLDPLIRLLSDSCNTVCSLDRGIALYDACLTIRNQPLNEKDYKDEEEKGYAFRTKQMHSRMRDYHILNLIANGGYGAFFIHSVGYKHDAEPFISMIRDFYENDIRNIQIIYLTSRELDQDEQDQLAQFKALKELEDTLLYIENLEADPIPFLLKFRPNSYPDLSASK